MSTDEVRIVASLQDMVSAPLDKVEAKVKRVSTAVTGAGRDAQAAGTKWSKAGSQIDKTGQQAQNAGRHLDKTGQSVSRTAAFVDKAKASWVGYATGTLLATVGLQKVISFLKGSATAAAADQESVRQLADTMDTLGKATDDARVEDWIRGVMLATGIADDELRPSYDRWIRSTRDVGKAEDLLQLSIDIGAKKRLDASAVTKSLARAYDGNTTALGRMGLGLDAAWLKTATFAEIQEKLTALYGGSASVSAEGYTGQLKRLETAAGEASETIGYSLFTAVGSVDKALGGDGGVDGAIGAVTAFGESMALNIDKTGTAAANTITALAGSLDQLTGGLLGNTGSTEEWGAAWQKSGGWIGALTTGIIPRFMDVWDRAFGKKDATIGAVSKDVTRGLMNVFGATEKVNPRMTAFLKVLEDTQTPAQLLAREVDNYASDMADASKDATALGFAQRTLTGDTNTLASAVDRLDASFDLLGGKKSSAIDAEIAMRRAITAAKTALDDPSTKGVVEHTAAVTKDGTGFNLHTKTGQAAAEALNQIRDTTVAASKAAFDEGDFQKARDLLKDGRTQLADQATLFGLAGDKARDYARDLLGMPKELTTNLTLTVNGKATASPAYIAGLTGAGGQPAYRPWSSGAVQSTPTQPTAAPAGRGRTAPVIKQGDVNVDLHLTAIGTITADQVSGLAAKLRTVSAEWQRELRRGGP